MQKPVQNALKIEQNTRHSFGVKNEGRFMIFWLFLGVGWVSAGRRLGVGWAAGGGVKTSGCRVCGSLGGSFGFHGCFWGHMGAFLDCSWLLWVHFEIILELFRCNFGIISKAIWDHFGIILGSFWGRSGIILLSF